MSWNLLAPMYVRPFDNRTGAVQEFAAFKWATEEVLDWDFRKPQLLATMAASQMDVICLQEVQFEPTEDVLAPDVVSEAYGLPRWLDPLLESYEAHIPDQADLKQMAERNARVLQLARPVGNAVLAKKGRVEALPLLPGHRNSTTRVVVGLRGAPASGLEASLAAGVVVSCVHLDACDESKRVKHLAKCLAASRSCPGHPRRVVICGDMNTEMLPGSCVAEMLDPPPQPTAAEIERECASALRVGPDGTEDEEGGGEQDISNGTGG
eukprot:CAMPEP_0181309462 /NCGR_PEP_ID=MMETSP1101-20121128/12025_1 /TAXON_ID=46948 /ORGANISM="Rhodomonas abbreviata, Strain Caron Lab Isolate" /LENGTH=265 /DNA_ID=CAMNT_0023415945 /DNA_START=190 /DNA_END=984 /DNA_ORIENTATION=-